MYFIFRLLTNSPASHECFRIVTQLSLIWAWEMVAKADPVRVEVAWPFPHLWASFVH